VHNPLKKGISMTRLLLFLLAFYVPFISAEYVYPVAACNAEQVYVLYQKSTDHIELWLWNSITKKASKALLSTFSPAGLQLLPDGSSFSFIDNDRIRVKSQGRRQPRAVGFCDPVYNVTLIQWIDNESFYFSAKEKEHFGIFHGTVYGTCHRVMSIKHGDCMYPQLRGQELFFIERDDNNDYAIVAIPYPKIPHDECVPCTDPEKIEERVKAIMQERSEVIHRSYGDASKKALIANFGNRPIAFLQMISDSFGIVIEHPTSINRSDNVIPFTCYAIELLNNEWNTRSLFSFAIPAQLLVSGSEQRLYESLLPLLLRYDGEKTIFFVNANKFDQGLNIYSYRLDDRNIEQRSHSGQNGAMFFPPLCSKFGNWYGGTLTMTDELSADQVCMYFDNDGDVCFNLPLVGE
jgi:hypothetical protein